MDWSSLQLVRSGAKCKWVSSLLVDTGQLVHLDGQIDCAVYGTRGYRASRSAVGYDTLTTRRADLTNQRFENTSTLIHNNSKYNLRLISCTSHHQPSWRYSVVAITTDSDSLMFR